MYQITQSKKQKRVTMKNRVNFAFILVLLVTLISGSASTVQAADPAGNAYIIVFKDTADPTSVAQGLAHAYGLQTGFIYEHALKGMSAILPAGRLIALQHDPR